MPPPLAVIVTVLAEVTTDVVIGYVAVVAPAATVTLVGTWATPGRLLDRVTTSPPAGAGPFNMTVPVDGLPPWTVLGLMIWDEIMGDVTVSLADLVAPR
jgi:hypothetical protein